MILRSLRSKSYPESKNLVKEGFDGGHPTSSTEQYGGSIETNVAGERLSLSLPLSPSFSLSLTKDSGKKSCCNRARKLSSGESIRLTRFSVTYFITPTSSTSYTLYPFHILQPPFLSSQRNAPYGADLSNRSRIPISNVCDVQSLLVRKTAF